MGVNLEVNYQQLVVEKYIAGGSVVEVTRELAVSEATLYRVLDRNKVSRRGWRVQQVRERLRENPELLDLDRKLLVAHLKVSPATLYRGISLFGIEVRQDN